MSELMGKFIEYKSFHDTAPLYYVEGTNKAITLYLKNRCSWMQAGAGCAMCGYSCRENIHADNTIRDYIGDIIKTVSGLKNEQNTIKIRMNGSFFSDEEISMQNRLLLLNTLKDKCGIANFRVESRVEFLNKDIIMNILGNTEDIKMEVAIGLESIDSNVLKYSINKGLIWEQFVEKYNEINSLVNVKVYLLLKPPFLTENESISDVINSVKTLAAMGVPSITINPAAVQKDTLLEALVQEGLYRPLWLWSIVELNSRLKEINKGSTIVNAARLSYYPEPILFPFNCEYCSSVIHSVLINNKNAAWDDIDISCGCLDSWKQEMETIDNRSIIERYHHALKKFDILTKHSNEICGILGADRQELLTDEAKTMPEINTYIDFVGISELPVEFPFHYNDTVKNINGNCSVEIDLDEFHKGTHMSRIVDAITIFCDEIHYDLLKDIENLLRELIKGQAKNKGRISFSLALHDSIYAPITKRKSIVKVPLIISLMVENKSVYNEISIEYGINNICPCVKTGNFEMYSTSLSHMQRGKVKYTISDYSGDITTLIKFCLENQQLYTSLKREDEIFIVNELYENAFFCEDICRKKSVDFENRFSGVFKKCIVHIKTEESIHVHNVSAEKIIYGSRGLSGKP